MRTEVAKGNQTKPEKLARCLQKQMARAGIWFCLLNMQFFGSNLPAQLANASTGEQTEVTMNGKNTSTGDNQHRLVDFQFGGSLCPVCLNAFKLRLLSLSGVENVEISVDKSNPKSGHPPKVAHAFVGYDPERISKENLIETIKHNDFQFLVAKEKVSSNENLDLKR